MKQFKYFGNGVVEAEDVTLRKFGQVYQIAPTVALDLLSGGVAILPPDLFDEVGFNREEIGDRRKRTPENSEYMDKHRRALARSKAYREELATELSGVNVAEGA